MKLIICSYFFTILLNSLNSYDWYFNALSTENHSIGCLFFYLKHLVLEANVSIIICKTSAQLRFPSFLWKTMRVLKIVEIVMV